MTIVNSTYKFIYVHIPRTGGTALKKFFGQFTRFCDVEVGGARDAEEIAHFYRRRFGLAKHSFAGEIRKAIGEEIFSGFFRFSMVRNPFARALSTFRLLKFTWRDWHGSGVMEKFTEFDDFVASDFFAGPGPDRIFLPQSLWLHDAENNPYTNYIGRTENVERDAVAICERLGLVPKQSTVFKTNQSKVARASRVLTLTDGAIDTIRLRYAADFENFGYSCDPEKRQRARLSGPF